MVPPLAPPGRRVDIGGGRHLHYVPLGSGSPMVIFESGGAGGFGALGSRPLIVLSHGVSFGGEMAPWEQGFAQSQQRLAALSSNSAHIVAAGIGHSIALEHPGLVAAAIQAVVEAAKGRALDTAEAAHLASVGPGQPIPGTG